MLRRHIDGSIRDQRPKPYMLRHFPFEGSFDPSMGMRALKLHEPLCEVDLNRYQLEISLKQQLLTEAYAYYFRGGDVMEYKAITPIETPLVSFLQERAAAC